MIWPCSALVGIWFATPDSESSPFTLTAIAESLQSCPTLCDPIDGSPPGSPISEILQARILEWGCHFLLQRMKVKSENEVSQSRPTLSDPMDCSLPGSFIHGIFQARVLEWGAIAFSEKQGYIKLKNFCTMKRDYQQKEGKVCLLSERRYLQIL